MPRKQRRLTVGFAGLLTLAMCAAAAPASAATAHSHQGGEAHYVNCAAATPGTGTKSAPWNSLAQVNEQAFGPAQKLLFKRGTTCEGTLEPHGSGTKRSPFVISDYGRGSDRATIDGNGAPAAIKIVNSEHIALENLAVTNATLPASQRRGVLIQLQDYGTGSGYLVKNLDVHDIAGGDLKGPDGSQGIALKVTGSDKPTRFNDVRIAQNTLDHIDRQGIVAVLSSWNSRPEEHAGSKDNWLPSTNVVIERNRLRDLGGDGIVANTTDGALVERNTVVGFNKRSAGYNAGIWDYNTDNSLFQYNDVSGGAGHRDGMAYDVDQGNIGTTFQYNYSHDNEGGFFLLCNNGPGIVRGAVIRHNVSRNDSYRGIENCRGPVESAKFTHNVIYIGDGISQTVVNENTTSLRHVDFRRNVVTKVGSGVADFNLKSGGYTFERNVFAGVENPPAQ